MPYLQIEVQKFYPIETKKHLAKELGAAYAEIMEAAVERVTISIRELGEGSIWRCSKDEPWPAAIMMLDVRAGRTPETREALSKKFIEICNEVLELEVNQLNIEFTQHTGDEMYHQWMGHLSKDWVAGEK
ncbi:tautomerase family protein [Mucilaginibacter endophyticus]|uniref:tautomerase family protein n=1 Tax=Mucilaginibacter endophyticus TaxID=2675003 RepID=UPI000E0E0094|nr:tautomerase [Mucilaginibacter endophyticus]